MYFTTIKRAMCNILPDLVVHLFTFICKYIFNRFFSILQLLCTHDFTTVVYFFAAEFCTNLVYNSICVIDYDYIFSYFSSKGSYLQWGKKVFSQPPIVQVLPLKKMREACNFHHRYTSTMRDKIRKKIQKITL